MIISTAIKQVNMYHVKIHSGGSADKKILKISALTHRNKLEIKALRYVKVYDFDAKTP